VLRRPKRRAGKTIEFATGECAAGDTKMWQSVSGVTFARIREPIQFRIPAITAGKKNPLRVMRKNRNRIAVRNSDECFAE
jgi:hypothetical protein